MSLSFSKFCEQLDAPLYNKAWSWSAKSRNSKYALFTVWSDQIDDKRFVFNTEPRESDTRVKPGRTELIKILREVSHEGLASYGIECKAEDIDANPRHRVSFETDYLLDLRVTNERSQFIGHIAGHISPNRILERSDASSWASSSAINDIDHGTIGNNDPEYRKRMAGSYERDAKVRKLVLKRAGGKCEYCEQPGFKTSVGKIFLETHHIISLSEQGIDKISNVIALCPNHHREAHFGQNWKEMQTEFQRIIKKKIN